MKKGFLVLAASLLLCSSAFADQCGILFATGTEYYRQGVSHFNNGKTLLERAIKEYESGDQQKGCKTLEASYGQIVSSHQNFGACQESFEQATTVCAGDNATIAEQNRNVCAQATETMEQNATYIQQMYAQYCQ